MAVMEVPSLETIEKLVRAGEEAGFTVEQMIDLLHSGLTISALLDLIQLRLSPPPIPLRSSRWIM
jgi:hypothetical protein